MNELIGRPTKLGWCLTNHHSRCPYATNGFVCTCSCHTREDTNDDQ